MAKKKGSKKEKENTSREPVAEQATVIQVDPDMWVKLDFKLLNWKYMNFSAKVRDNSRVFSLKKMITSKHGHVRRFIRYSVLLFKKYNIFIKA